MLQPVGVRDLGKRPFLWLPHPVWSADFQNQLTSTEVLAGNAVEGVHHALEAFAEIKSLACTLDHGMCLPVLIHQLTERRDVDGFVCSLFCLTVGS